MRNFFARLFGRRERQLRQLVIDAQQGARPLTLTEICHDRFSITLPGAWRELSRDAESCELVSAAGREWLSITVRRLVVAPAEDELPAVAQQLLRDRQSSLAAAGSIAWTEPETCCHAGVLQLRSDGYQSANHLCHAVLLRIGPDAVLSGTLAAQADPIAMAAFSNLATVLFQRLAAS